MFDLHHYLLTCVLFTFPNKPLLNSRCVTFKLLAKRNSTNPVKRGIGAALNKGLGRYEQYILVVSRYPGINTNNNLY